MSGDKTDQRKEPGKDGQPPEYISIRVTAQDGNEILFRVKLNTSMRKVMKSYSDRTGLPENNLRFLFDGRRIQEDMTPKMLGLDNDDVIEVYHEQTGGL